MAVIPCGLSRFARGYELGLKNAMQPKGLIDTGAILALLDADDRWHIRCLEAFPSLRLPLATSAAVLAEAFHLLGDHPQDVEAAWRFLRSGAVRLLPITDADTANLEQLMKRYHDCPMDFADATLVCLAERESLSTIFTIDHNDFETYRIDGRVRFRIVPSR
jgi:predicted nucleic acid-binding protein